MLQAIYPASKTAGRTERVQTSEEPRRVRGAREAPGQEHLLLG